MLCQRFPNQQFPAVHLSDQEEACQPALAADGRRPLIKSAKATELSDTYNGSLIDCQLGSQLILIWVEFLYQE